MPIDLIQQLSHDGLKLKKNNTFRRPKFGLKKILSEIEIQQKINSWKQKIDNGKWRFNFYFFHLIQDHKLITICYLG